MDLAKDPAIVRKPVHRIRRNALQDLVFMSPNKSEKTGVGLLIAVGCCFLVSCSGETDLLAEAKKKAAAAATTISETAKDVAHQTASDLTGAKPVASVTVDREYADLGCYLRFRQLSDGRGAILQVLSYEDEQGADDPTTYLIHAPVSEVSFAALAGRPLSGRFFFQSGDQVWYSREDQPVELKIDKGVLQSTILLSGTLTSANDNSTIAVSGVFTGVVE